MKKFAKILSAVLCLAMVLSFASIAIAAENNTVSVVIADYADANGWSNSTLYATVNLDSVVSVTTSGTAVGDYGQNTGKYYESDESWRIYQAENPSIVVSAGEQNIVSVKVTYVSNKDGVLTLNGTNVASDEVVSVNAPSVTFGVANTGTATNGQVRITAIEVVYDGKAGTAPTPTPTEPTPTEPTVPVATFKAEIVSALAAGDKVYVYYPNGDEAMSATANGKKLAGVTATKEGDFLMITEGAAELTVAIDANGYYTFTCNGLYLTSGETGNQLYFAEAASDYSLWELTVEGDGYLIRNVNAAYYGNANQYLEYYNGFTTYGLKETSDRAAYTFAFAKAVADEEPPVTEPTEPETQPTEPETQPTEPETQPTEPETQPTEPETQPTEPETQPTEPETQPTEPETQPTEPETQPSEPETQPTEPPVVEHENITIAIGEKSFTTVDGKFLYNQDVTAATSTQYNMILIDKSFNGSFATNGYGVAIVLAKDGTLLRVYDGANVGFWTAEGKAASAHFGPNDYATVAFNELQENELLIVFTHTGSEGNVARQFGLDARHLIGQKATLTGFIWIEDEIVEPTEPETTAPAATETIKPTTPVNPGTGDNSPVMLAVGMMMAAACLIVLVQKKRAV